MKNNPILIIDDDNDDLLLVKEAIKQLQLPNEIIEFSDSQKAWEYLLSEERQPYFILCDINMPVVDGFELRQRISSNNLLKLKSIPFLFLSTAGDKKTIDEAYTLGVQGYFVKPNNFEDLKGILKSIADYWAVCEHPRDDNLRQDPDLSVTLQR